MIISKAHELQIYWSNRNLKKIVSYYTSTSIQKNVWIFFHDNTYFVIKNNV